jgi:ribosome-binding ATPase YchF (GTP1/OBG family)
VTGELGGGPLGEAVLEPECVGHTDFQKGFITAEIVSYDDLISAGSVPRDLGKVRMEGKDYVMADGDVVSSVQRLSAYAARMCG